MADTLQGNLDLCSIPMSGVVYLCPDTYIVYDSKLCFSFLSTEWSLSSLILSMEAAGCLERGLLIVLLNACIMSGTARANAVWVSRYIFNATVLKKLL